MGEMYSRRCMSETDLSTSWDSFKPKEGEALEGDILEARLEASSASVFPTSRRHPKASSLESDQSSISLQESPLDLSVRSSVSSTTGLSQVHGET